VYPHFFPMRTLKIYSFHNFERHNIAFIKGNPVICDNMDEPKRHYSKPTKSGTERQILYDFSYR
jgi:hypothetical protein